MQSEIRDNTVYVQGEVSVQTVDKTTLAQFAQQCGQPEIHAIDCSQITRADSACLSLLLTALRQREQGSLKIQFDLDTQHSNPWYHALMVQLPALDAAQQRLWQQYLAERDIEIFAPAE